MATLSADQSNAALFCVVVTPSQLTAAELAHITEVMDTRRRQLDRTWNEVAALGRISTETLRAARKTGSFSDKTRRGVEKALEWERGSFEAVADGREPIPSRPLPITDDPDAPTVVKMSDEALIEAAEAIRKRDGWAVASDFLAGAMRLRDEWEEKTQAGHGVTVNEADRDAG